MRHLPRPCSNLAAPALRAGLLSVLSVFGAWSSHLAASSVILVKPSGQTVTYPLTTTGDVSIAPVTGNVTVRPTASSGMAGDGWCPASTAPVPTLSFAVSPTSVATGGVATAIWSTANATSCSTTGSALPGSVANWPASLPTSSPGTFLTLNTAGTYSFRLACTGPGGTTVATQAVTASTAAPLPTVNFTVAPSTVAQGGTATAVWSTANATSCSGSGSALPGVVSNWTASLPTSSAGTALVLNTIGTYTFRLACTGTGGTTSVSRSVAVGTVPAPTVAFAVNPTSVAAGGVAAAVWSTTNATSCVSSGSTLPGTVAGWTTSLPTAHTGLGLTLTTQGAYNFRLSCTGAGGTTTVDRPVTVGPAIPTSCAGVPATFGLTRQTAMVNTGFLQGNSEHPNGTLQVTSFNVIAGPWPARVQNGTLAIYPGKYVALEFNTGTVNQGTYGGTATAPNRFGSLETAPPAANAGSVLFAISECPGDFTARLPNNDLTFCRHFTGFSRWPWGVGVPVGTQACNLSENRTYYLNAAYVDPGTGVSSCASPESSTGSNPFSCHWFMQPR